MNPEKLRHSNYRFRNFHNIGNKLTRFQKHPETELACKNNKPFYKTQYSANLFEYEQSFDMETGKKIINPHATLYSTSDKNSYIPIHLLKTQERLVEK